MSPFLNSLTYLTLPFALVLGGTHMMYGHDQPGDGFTAGVIISLAVALWYVVFGYEKTRQRLRWLNPASLIAGGLLLAIGTAIVTGSITGSFFGSFNYGDAIGLPLPAGFYFSSAFLFEVAICLTVLGSMAYMLNTLGHPTGKSELTEAKTGYSANGSHHSIEQTTASPQTDGEFKPEATGD